MDRDIKIIAKEINKESFESDNISDEQNKGEQFEIIYNNIARCKQFHKMLEQTLIIC